jgi:hypothetical protein
MIQLAFLLKKFYNNYCNYVLLILIYHITNTTFYYVLVSFEEGLGTVSSPKGLADRL